MKQYLTESEVEEIFGIPVKTLRNFRFTGGAPFPFIKIGRKVMYDRNKIVESLEENTFQSTTEANEAQLARA